MIDTTNNYLGIYRGGRGAWNLDRFWICSTGAPATPTVLGEYTVKAKGYSFGHGYTCYYYTQFYGDYLIHSVKYYQGTFNVLDGRMGMNISEGCIRLPIDQAKWIWDNVPTGTKVVTYR
nr:L,D-transpeptidase [Enorma phocaeensis]